MEFYRVNAIITCVYMRHSDSYEVKGIVNWQLSSYSITYFAGVQ